MESSRRSRRSSLRIRTPRSEEHTSELQSHVNLVCRLLLEKKKNTLKQHCSQGQPAHWGRAATCAPRLPRDGQRCRGRVLRQRALRGGCALVLFFFNDPGPPESYPLSLHAAFPI